MPRLSREKRSIMQFISAWPERRWLDDNHQSLDAYTEFSHASGHRREGERGPPWKGWRGDSLALSLQKELLPLSPMASDAEGAAREAGRAESARSRLRDPETGFACAQGRRSQYFCRESVRGAGHRIQVETSLRL